MSTPRNVPASIATPTAPVPAGGAPLASTLRAPFRHVPIPRSRRTRRARGQHPPDHPPTGGNSPCRARRPMAKPTDSDHEEEGNGGKVLGRKRHLLVDIFGLILRVHVHPADEHDR